MKSQLVRIWWNSFFEVRPCWEKQNALVIFQNGHPTPAAHQKQKGFIFNLHRNLAVLLGLKSRDMWCLSTRQDTMDFLTPKLVYNEATTVHQWCEFPHTGTGSRVGFYSSVWQFSLITCLSHLGHSGLLCILNSVMHLKTWWLSIHLFLVVRRGMTSDLLTYCTQNEWNEYSLTDAEAPVLWPPDVKSWLIKKDPVPGKY